MRDSRLLRFARIRRSSAPLSVLDCSVRVMNSVIWAGSSLGFLNFVVRDEGLRVCFASLASAGLRLPFRFLVVLNLS